MDDVKKIVDEVFPFIATPSPGMIRQKEALASSIRALVARERAAAAEAMRALVLERVTAFVEFGNTFYEGKAAEVATKTARHLMKELSALPILDSAPAKETRNG